MAKSSALEPTTTVVEKKREKKTNDSIIFLLDETTFLLLVNQMKKKNKAKNIPLNEIDIASLFHAIAMCLLEEHEYCGSMCFGIVNAVTISFFSEEGE